MSANIPCEQTEFSSLRRRIQQDFQGGEEQLTTLRRQYRQRIRLAQFTWPTEELLRDYEVQQWIFETFKSYSQLNSSSDESSNLSRWEKGVWAELSKRIEHAVEGATEPDIFDPILEESARFQSATLPSDAQEAQKDTWVTYEFGDTNMLHDSSSIKLLERPRVLAGSCSTGHRTWEAALALGGEIITNWLPNKMLHGKKVLELGAGTGILSFLCASPHPYCARRVVATDGDTEVVHRLLENNVANKPTETSTSCSMSFGHFQWGSSFEQTIIREELEEDKFDIVLAADVTYDPTSIPDFVNTLTQLFVHNEKPFTCIVGATIRNKETFDGFLRTCESNLLHPVVCNPTQQNQTRFFHTNKDMIRFIKLSTTPQS